MSPRSTTATKAQQRARKPLLKTESSLGDRVQRLFTSLCAQIDGNHFTNAIKTCDKVLRLVPDDNDAKQTKLFLLLQTERYNDALSLLDEASAFERTYSLYRLQQLDEAAQLLGKVKQRHEQNRGALHLEAQLNYRQGNYQVALDLYNQLLDSSDPSSEEYSDILTNLQASQKHLDFIHTDYLRALDGLGSDVTGSLEHAPPQVPPSLSSVPGLGVTASASRTGDEGRKQAVRGVRSRRVPKGVVPGLTPPPDPERWLKKSERSTFQQARGKRKGGGGATQGVVESAGGPATGGHGGRSGGHGRGGKKKK
jgi:signal recognition particle subunit SRP72